MKRDSRSLILSAARAEFAASGLAGARVARIARRAGVNKQLLFYYFGSKAGLYKAAIDIAATEMSNPKGPSVAGSLREALGDAFRHLVDHPEHVALITHAARSPEGLAPSVVRAISQPWRDVRDAISAGQGVGLVRDDADSDTLAQQAVVLLVGYLALESFLNQLPRPLGREDWVASVADSFTRILAW